VDLHVEQGEARVGKSPGQARHLSRAQGVLGGEPQSHPVEPGGSGRCAQGERVGVEQATGGEREPRAVGGIRSGRAHDGKIRR
jgi:hypothetical protein